MVCEASLDAGLRAAAAGGREPAVRLLLEHSAAPDTMQVPCRRGGAGPVCATYEVRAAGLGWGGGVSSQRESGGLGIVQLV